MLRVQQLAETVLHDLRAQRPDLEPRVTCTPAEDPPGSGAVLVVDASGTGCGFSVDGSEGEDEVISALADGIPTAFVELFQVGLPVVPGTQRPAKPVTVDGIVSWQGPKGLSNWSCPVGELN